MKNIIVDDRIFTAYPFFTRGVCIARHTAIVEEDADLQDCLAHACREVQERGETILNDERIAAWEEAHRAFGSNPKRFPPSIRSLVDRVLRGKPLPFINSAVALFNTVSLHRILPLGGDDIDTITGDALLTFATGQETFIPLGQTEIEHPVPGEVIYADSGSGNVMCRRWNWRNGDTTKIVAGIHDILINVDGIGHGVTPMVETATLDIARYFEAKWGASVRTELLHAGKRCTTV